MYFTGTFCEWCTVCIKSPHLPKLDGLLVLVSLVIIVDEQRYPFDSVIPQIINGNQGDGSQSVLDVQIGSATRRTTPRRKRDNVGQRPMDPKIT